MSVLVAIYGAGGKLAGSGTIVSDSRILTCAHVVNTALGRTPGKADRPRQERHLTVRFAGAPGEQREAEIDGADWAWSPPPAAGASGADLCVLSLTKAIPEGASIAAIRPVTALSNTNVLSAGYPGDWNRPSGSASLDFAKGEILGQDGYLWLLRADSGSWAAALKENKRVAGLIYSGFSGGPVMSGGLVIGIIAEVRKDIKEATAYLIPAYFFPKAILPPADIASRNSPSRRLLEVAYESGHIITQTEYLGTLAVFYDRVLLPYRDATDSFMEFTRPVGQDGRFKLEAVEIDGLHANLGDRFRYLLKPGDSGEGVDAGESVEGFDAGKIGARWDNAHSELFAEGVLSRLGAPAEELDYDLLFSAPGRLEEIAARFADLDFVLRSTRDGRSWVGGREQPTKGPQDVIYLPTSHLKHLLRRDLQLPGIFVPRDRKWREIAKVVMAHSAITYLLPKLDAMPVDEILRIREMVSSTREGFAMHLQSLTGDLFDAIDANSTPQDITRHSDNVVETKLIPSYREYIRQIESSSSSSQSVITGSVETSAALPSSRLTDELMATLGLSGLDRTSATGKFTNQNQAFQFMRSIERQS